MYQNDMSILYKHLKTLDMLYRQSVLGDSFVDSITQDSTQKQKVSISTQTTHQYNVYNSNNSTYNNLQSNTERVMQCRLCSISKYVKDSERMCAILPTNKSFINTKDTQNINIKPFPNIAFITETLHLKEAPKNGYALLENLQLNRSNEMLFDIIEKVFLFHKESVYFFPLFKCAEVGDNQQISMLIRTQQLTTQRRICSNYLKSQLENVSYAIFFGEHICFDFFEISLQEANGKLLDYHTIKGTKVICICVPDIMQMLMNSKFKKDAFINFVLLRNVIYANSC